MKLGSLFDGSGGFPLAGTLCGIEPVWAAEVEPYPIAVTRSRFPNMKHLGDVKRVKGGEIEPVDVVAIGSPCQGLSQAGLRLGLEDDRSGLFVEAVRIVKEMREATNGLYPTVILWENVPGAFSSNKGEDFKVVLEEIVKVKEPTAVMPEVPQGGWAYADCYRGDGWSLAYRVFDAQYWGVPQRRRRIYLVADFTGQCAKEILFERQGLRGHFETGRTPWQDYSANAQNGIGADGVLALDRASFNQGKNAQYDFEITNSGVNSTLVAQGPSAVSYAMQGFGDYKESQQASACKARDHKDATDLVVERAVRYIVRRLTPTECARLQGFADRWGWLENKKTLTDDEYRFWLEVRNTHAAINGKAVKEYTEKQMLKWYNKLWNDSAEYKMWGNGIALPTALYCMQGIADALERRRSYGQQ